MLSDIEIAQNAEMYPIGKIAAELSIAEEDIEYYGHYKAKLSEQLFQKLDSKPNGKLILVTAINPTPAGEGKTTVSVGLADALHQIGKKTVLALREPSLGPVFGIKGGAAGGGYAQVVPMEDINLHFTGDMHAITSANNLLCAMLDNHMQQGNVLRIDQRRVMLKRVLDMNDRALRNIVIGLGGKVDGIPRSDSFQITVASEVMAILCLASDLADLKERLGKILVAYDLDGNPVYAKDLGANGAMTALLKDALKPNLVQTLEHTPALIHGGPFANIDIKCRYGGLKPDCVVLVATVRALKYNGGVPKTELTTENLDALKKGIVNLQVHIENMKKYGVPVVVAINRFQCDTDAELHFIQEFCESLGAEFALTEVFAKGGAGGKELAEKVCKTIETKPSNFHVLYDTELSVEEKVEKIAKEIYRADGVTFTAPAKKALAQINALGCGNLPVCVAKTQYSLSDDAAKLGKPEHFTITVRDVTLSNGAGFVVVLTGNIMTMPGLPKAPSALKIDCDNNGNITGLF